MTPECPLCVVSGISGQAWTATGRFITKRLSKPFIAAELRCLRAECRGRTWTSGLPEAVAAGQAVRVEQGLEPYALRAHAGESIENVLERASNRAAPLLRAEDGFEPPSVMVRGQSVDQVIAHIRGTLDVKQRASGGDN